MELGMMNVTKEKRAPSQARRTWKATGSLKRVFAAVEKRKGGTCSMSAANGFQKWSPLFTSDAPKVQPRAHLLDAAHAPVAVRMG
jgi:hypothetical protein